jgi:gamma-glutamyltranspeptidase/glutathione hydrolase
VKRFPRLAALRAVLIVLALLPWLAAAATGPAGHAIASAHPLATRAGDEILDEGGNAFDAAVAITAALAVVEPMGSGLGGGGFWLLHRAADAFEVMVDGRERAPLAATADMYLDGNREVVPGLSLDGPLAAAVPGTPAAVVHLAAKYGRLPLARSLAPAIRYAAEGFRVDDRYLRLARFRQDALLASPAAARIFLDDGFVPEEGFLLRQPELAATLERIAKEGREGFYGGDVARRMVQGVRAAGGIWCLEDLAQYGVVERRPVVGEYAGMRVVSSSLPSSGGVVLVSTLNVLSGLELEGVSPGLRAHRIIEAMRRTYRDRALYLGDADYVPVDVPRLLSADHATELRESIEDQATPSAALGAQAGAGVDTTHFSVIDAEGNRVAATLSINYPFGSGFVPEGTGVLLNNEMDDFVAKPGVPNVYGLVGSSANGIAPGKRPLSSMTPTFLETEDAVVALGTPGGSRIISMVLLAALEVAAGRGGPDDWVALPRFHHQYLPDEVVYEPGAFGEDVVEDLEARGHKLAPRDRPYGNMQIVMLRKKDGALFAASDPRGEGEGMVRERQPLAVGH